MKTLFAVLQSVVIAVGYGLFTELLASRLNRRAGKLRERYGRTGDLADLQRAITLLQKAVTRVEPGSPNARVVDGMPLPRPSRRHSVSLPESDRAVAGVAGRN